MAPAPRFDNALCHGYERLAAWADLLDRINVFPVADADTGINLKISLAPLRQPGPSPRRLRDNLLRAATGNSGNIACAFFGELIGARGLGDLPQRIPAARDKARQAVIDPQPGTMLTIFDALAESVGRDGWTTGHPDCTETIAQLEAAVAATTSMLPDLKQAGVVDAGALGMFIFLEACFAFLFASPPPLRPVTDIFPSGLSIRAGWAARNHAGEYCVNTMIQSDAGFETVQQALDGYGSSIVVSGMENQIKVHAHTSDRDGLRKRLSRLGAVTHWAEDTMDASTVAPVRAGDIHIMTDAAGSLTIEDARQLGMTLLGSYLIVGDRIFPETLLDPADLYAAMASGTRVTTAQASVFERHQCYLHTTRRFDRVLYLCVGSVYTGNYQTAIRWQAASDDPDRLTVVDTGSASGRLGIAAMATARFARTASTADSVQAFAEKALADSRELVFLDTLKYLAAGGRISRTKGFFGNLLHLKPIISPEPEGAAKVGVVRNRREQLDFALQRLSRDLGKAASAMILMQYTDNRPWVETTVLPQIASRYPAAEILLRPISLTSGAHMGPGTWAVAYLPM
ncbi:DegV family protein [Desulfosarcina ovata]|uniref:Dihydroxyacetone kinase n=1 Tax=Desulfosarcina ovata subsp. ovata TaxID=2752305 RepID=A0A5K8A9J5_9BACT|nr:DegV family protein [Desulfosarcina ovata]BBO88864.1 dihydroxyacetone kinase [Desulfosarcina ovata subsp. ovata]